MRNVLLALLLLLCSQPVQAIMLLQNTPVSDIRFESSNPEQGTAWVSEVIHGQKVQIAVGDAIGFDQAEVTAIKTNEIHLDLGYESIRLRRLPGENTFTIIQRGSGD